MYVFNYMYVCRYVLRVLSKMAYRELPNRPRQCQKSSFTTLVLESSSQRQNKMYDIHEYFSFIERGNCSCNSYIVISPLSAGRWQNIMLVCSSTAGVFFFD